MRIQTRAQQRSTAGASLLESSATSLQQSELLFPDLVSPSQSRARRKPVKRPPLLVPERESGPGRKLKPKEIPTPDTPLLVLVDDGQGNEVALDRVFASVGMLPCADLSYFLVVAWEQRLDPQAARS